MTLGFLTTLNYELRVSEKWTISYIKIDTMTKGGLTLTHPKNIEIGAFEQKKINTEVVSSKTNKESDMISLHV